VNGAAVIGRAGNGGAGGRGWTSTLAAASGGDGGDGGDGGAAGDGGDGGTGGSAFGDGPLNVTGGKGGDGGNGGLTYGTGGNGGEGGEAKSTLGAATGGDGGDGGDGIAIGSNGGDGGDGGDAAAAILPIATGGIGGNGGTAGPGGIKGQPGNNGTETGATAPMPVFVLPPNTPILTADSSHLLYKASDGSVLVRDLTAGSEVSLADSTTLKYDTDWSISGGLVYVFGQDTDCTPSFVCVYEWPAPESRRNLSKESGIPADYYQHPVAKDGYAIWINQQINKQGSYTLYNSASQTFTRIAPPASVNYVGNWQYDFAVVGGVVDFWYWGQTGGAGTGSNFDIFNWRSDTADTTRITNNGLQNVYTQVDNTRAAWEQRPVGSFGLFTLISQNVLTGSTQTLGTLVRKFGVDDGVVAWVENPSGGGRVLKAVVAGPASILSNSPTASLLAVGGGYVIFAEGGKTYSWNSASGEKALLLDATSEQTFVDGGQMISRVNDLVYRIALQ